ncbi:MAG: glyoxalase [Actinobacteria bacterium]|nr:glyoxalase [Actinomycetota bacterium]
MTIKSIYPDICASDLTASRDFYTALVGLKVAWESDWYIVLNAPDADPGGMQLALVAAGHDSVPVDYQQPPAGVLISFEVDNATELYEHAISNGLAVAQELRDEEFGQRHFMAVDPDGLLVDVVELLFIPDQTPEQQ